MTRTRRIPDQREVRRRSAMMRHGILCADLASRWGTSQPFVTHLLSGKRRALDRERDFAQLVGEPYSTLWPPHPETETK